jgi:hypothetical protein
LAKNEFFGSDGAYISRDLVGGFDIRDFLQNIFTNTINSPNTQNVFTSSGTKGTVRLDNQAFDLPAGFLDETLDTVRLTDTGRPKVQRTWLAGITVETIPEPTTTVLFSLLPLGHVSLCCSSRR